MTKTRKKHVTLLSVVFIFFILLSHVVRGQNETSTDTSTSTTATSTDTSTSTGSTSTTTSTSTTSSPSSTSSTTDTTTTTTSTTTTTPSTTTTTSPTTTTTTSTTTATLPTTASVITVHPAARNKTVNEEAECGAKTDCQSCVAITTARCYFCETPDTKRRGCRVYPIQQLFPTAAQCTLNEARVGYCWINWNVLIISGGVLLGIILLALTYCICRCCCCRGKKRNKEISVRQAAYELESAERSDRATERRQVRDQQMSAIRQKYGLSPFPPAVPAAPAHGKTPVPIAPAHGKTPPTHSVRH